jgi:hypothetical protein
VVYDFATGFENLPSRRINPNYSASSIGVFFACAIGAMAAQAAGPPADYNIDPGHFHGQLRPLRGWRCRYDLQKGTFDVPPEFAEKNAEAIAPGSE